MEVALADVASQASLGTSQSQGDAAAFEPVSQDGADVAASSLQAAGNEAGTETGASGDGPDGDQGESGTPFETVAASAALPESGETIDGSSGSQSAESAIASARVAQAAGPLPVPSAAPRPGSGTAAVAANPAGGAEARPIQVASASPQIEKRGFLSSLFSTQPPRPAMALADTGRSRAPAAAPKPAATARKAVRTASLTSDLPAGATGSLTALPGVRAESLFEITRKSGGYDDSDVDINEADDRPVRVASVTGLARLAPNGLAVQTADVDVACLKPQLVRVLKTLERHYGQKVVVTSGYRSPKRNRRARGAKNSLHMYCAAADIQIAGVSKWDLAKYLRTMPGRGGVGTYCHTQSVHVDIGPERDWNWRCRRSSRKRK
ncbi:D-Ala-D-Ala carboxypeptidase family metallohydrolase [Zhengella sp. ZM62]|uniref:YcbK family protein n=1 Tax=Zhengella sedimenti TaxID=3390035 RepID=UPI0039751C5D